MDDWGEKIRMVKYARNFDSKEEMKWTKKAKMVELVEKANLKDATDEQIKAFHDFILENIHEFDNEAFEILFNTIELTTEKMANQAHFCVKLYQVVKDLDMSMYGYKAKMKLAYFLTICKEEFNF